MHRFGSQFLSLVLLVASSGCLSTRPSATVALAQYAAALSREYGQLAGGPTPFGLGHWRSRVFKDKRARVEAGECVEPEALADWRGWERVHVSIPALGGDVGAAELRQKLLTLELAARMLPQKSKFAYPDADTARAHLLGRFDCVLILGTSQSGQVRAQRCAAELGSAASYLAVALGSAPPVAAAGAKLCPTAKT